MFCPRPRVRVALSLVLFSLAASGCSTSTTGSPHEVEGGIRPDGSSTGDAATDSASGAQSPDGTVVGPPDGSVGGSAVNACSGTGAQVPTAERVSNGNPLLPPKWAFGILWGSYYDQIGSTFAQGGNILTAATQLRASYSGDLMWIDSSWLWHNYSGDPAGTPDYINFKFDSTTFPDPSTMIQTLQAEHFHFGVWEWPWMDHGCEYFQDAVTNKYFIMNGANPALATTGWHGDPNPAEFDFTNPATVTWWTGLNEPRRRIPGRPVDAGHLSRGFHQLHVVRGRRDQRGIPGWRVFDDEVFERRYRRKSGRHDRRPDHREVRLHGPALLARLHSRDPWAGDCPGGGHARRQGGADVVGCCSGRGYGSGRLVLRFDRANGMGLVSSRIDRLDERFALRKDDLDAERREQQPLQRRVRALGARCTARRRSKSSSIEPDSPALSA